MCPYDGQPHNLGRWRDPIGACNEFAALRHHDNIHCLLRRIVGHPPEFFDDQLAKRLALDVLLVNGRQ